MANRTRRISGQEWDIREWGPRDVATTVFVGKSIPPARRQALVADLATNDARFCRRVVRRYFEYLDRHGSLVPRLCTSGVKAVVAFGDNDDDLGLGIAFPYSEYRSGRR